ncbi:MAG: ABC transporter permease [Campylobacterales bacterium]|nr:ABC transporter permease [Campylobacterales bacterium]
MSSLLLRKMLYLLGMTLLISFISFVAINAAPNSFLSAGELNPNMTPQAIERLKQVYGLDKPMLEQYVGWLWSMAHLDFGVSFVSGQSVIDEIAKRLPITLSMNIAALIAVFALSIWLGIKAAVSFEHRSDHLIRQISLISFAMPSFYLALLGMLLFSVWLGWLPIAGVHSVEPKSGLAYYLDMVYHLILPVGVMVFVSIGSMTLYIRSLTLEILKSDYLFFARARGLSERTILRRYILPNLLPPVVTLLGLSLPGLIGGSVILEAIFGIEGMGQLFYLSALSRDYPVIMGILTVGALLTLLGNMSADLLLMRLSPFMKRSVS